MLLLSPLQCFPRCLRYILRNAGREGFAIERERETVERARNGDAEAFEEIVDAYKAYLFAVVLPLVGDVLEAQDVLQEVFLKVWLRLPEFKGGSVRAWLARLAVNAAIDWRRKAARLRTSETGAETNAVAPAAEDECMKEVRMNYVAGAVKSLPSVYRRTLLMYYSEGLDYAAIAEREGVSPKTVESRLYRARKLLKEALKRHETE